MFMKMGNLNTLFFQVFRFEGFFHDHDFPVGRGEDRVILHDNVPVGETEKVYHKRYKIPLTISTARKTMILGMKAYTSTLMKAKSTNALNNNI